MSFFAFELFHCLEIDNPEEKLKDLLNFHYIEMQLKLTTTTETRVSIADMVIK